MGPHTMPWMVGHPETIQKRASGKSIDDVLEADFWGVSVRCCMRGHRCGMRQGKTEARTKWRGLVSEQNQSGQSAATFCRERGLRA